MGAGVGGGAMEVRVGRRASAMMRVCCRAAGTGAAGLGGVVGLITVMDAAHHLICRKRGYLDPWGRNVIAEAKFLVEVGSYLLN